jgi:hypothetical protein
VVYSTVDICSYVQYRDVLNDTSGVLFNGEGGRRRNAYTRGADKSLARPGRKQATATEEFDFHISYL